MSLATTTEQSRAIAARAATGLRERLSVPGVAGSCRDAVGGLTLAMILMTRVGRPDRSRPRPTLLDLSEG